MLTRLTPLRIGVVLGVVFALLRLLPLDALDRATARAVDAARARNGRVVAVGTTACRTLETCAVAGRRVAAGSGESRIFLHPGRELQVVDVLFTNFHLPQSTLLMLVAAMVGREEVLRVYREAVREGYRFYSFGDAMLVV